MLKLKKLFNTLQNTITCEQDFNNKKIYLSQLIKKNLEKEQRDNSLEYQLNEKRKIEFTNLNR